MWALYRIDMTQDTWRVDVRVLAALLSRLPYEERSLWRADMAERSPATHSARQSFFGWSLEASILADLFDLINALRPARRKPAPYPRPHRRPAQPRTTADLMERMKTMFGVH